MGEVSGEDQSIEGTQGSRSMAQRFAQGERPEASKNRAPKSSTKGLTLCKRAGEHSSYLMVHFQMMENLMISN